MGGILTVIGIALSSFATELWHLYLGIGVVAGIGQGSMRLPPRILVLTLV